MIAGLCWSDSMKSILGRSLGFVEFDFDKVDPWLNFSEFGAVFFCRLQNHDSVKELRRANYPTHSH